MAFFPIVERVASRRADLVARGPTTYVEDRAGAIAQDDRHDQFSQERRSGTRAGADATF